MNDASVKRIDQHLLTTAMVARAAADPQRVRGRRVVAAVRPRPARACPPRCAATASRSRTRYGGVRALWLRPITAAPLTRRQPGVRLGRSRARPSASKPAQDRHPFDHRAERHHLRRDRQQHQPDQHEVARTAARRRARPRGRAPRRARSRRCRRASGARAGRRRADPQNAPITGAIAMPTASPRATSAIGIHATSPTLIARPGARSSRLARFAASAMSTASASSRRPDTNEHVRGEHERDRGAAEDLDHTGRDPPLRRARAGARESRGRPRCRGGRRSARAARSPGTRTARADARCCVRARHRARTRPASPRPASTTSTAITTSSPAAVGNGRSRKFRRCSAGASSSVAAADHEQPHGEQPDDEAEDHDHASTRLRADGQRARPTSASTVGEIAQRGRARSPRMVTTHQHGRHHAEHHARDRDPGVVQRGAEHRDDRRDRPAPPRAAGCARAGRACAPARGR